MPIIHPNSVYFDDGRLAFFVMGFPAAYKAPSASSEVPSQGRVAGLKSLSTDSGMPEPKDLPGVDYRPGGVVIDVCVWRARQRPPNTHLRKDKLRRSRSV